MTFWDLPLHPLVVHLVVVLVPLGAIGAVLSALIPNFSRRYASASVIIIGVALVASLLSRTSGQDLAREVSTTAEHINAGDVLPAFVGVFFVVTLVFWLFDRGVPLNRKRPIWLRLLAVVVIIVALVATYQTVIAGHTGAVSVWG